MDTPQTPDNAPRKRVKTPWKPEAVVSGSVETPRAGTVPAILGGALGTTQNDPSLNKIVASLLKLGGSRHHTARMKRFVAKNLTPKARARKKLARQSRLRSRRVHPANRGRKE